MAAANSSFSDTKGIYDKYKDSHKPQRMDTDMTVHRPVGMPNVDSMDISAMECVESTASEIHLCEPDKAPPEEQVSKTARRKEGQETRVGEELGIHIIASRRDHLLGTGCEV